MPTTTPVNSLVKFSLNGVVIPAYSGYLDLAPSVVSEGGAIRLPDDSSLWCEVRPVDVSGSLEAVIVAGDMQTNYMGFYESGSIVGLEFYFDWETFNTSQVRFGESFHFEEKAAVHAGIISTPGVSIQSIEATCGYDTDGYVYVSLMAELSEDSPAARSGLRFFIASTTDDDGPDPEPPEEFWTAFVGAHEAL